MVIADTGFDHLGIFSKNWHSHSTSLVALSRAINSDSIVNREMHISLKKFQDTTIPPSMKIYLTRAKRALEYDPKIRSTE